MIEIIESEGRMTPTGCGPIDEGGPMPWSSAPTDARLRAYMGLRKRRFHDELGWDVPIDGDLERDVYDEMDCIYILDTHEGRVRGGMRLMPTTQPTLLHDVFTPLMADATTFVGQDVWEITRFCICPDTPRAAFTVPRALFSALLDVSRARGIARHVAVTDPSVWRLLQWYGLKVREHAHEPSLFGCPVTLCDWEVDEDFIATVERSAAAERRRLLREIAREALADPTPASPIPARPLVAANANANADGADAELAPVRETAS